MFIIICALSKILILVLPAFNSVDFGKDAPYVNKVLSIDKIHLSSRNTFVHDFLFVNLEVNGDIFVPGPDLVLLWSLCRTTVWTLLTYPYLFIYIIWTIIIVVLLPPEYIYSTELNKGKGRDPVQQGCCSFIAESF